MSKGYRRHKWKNACIAGMVSILILLVLFAVYEYYGWENSKKNVSALQEKLTAYEREVYVAVKKLPKGTVLTKENMERQIRYSDYPQKVFITETAEGMSLALDVEEGTCLMNVMVCRAEDNVREYFLEDAEIPGHIQEGDRIDLRIRYGNAEEYVVLTDKIVQECHGGDGMVITLTENELLLVSSAIADTREFNKTKLYVVEYPEYDYKEKGQITYLANRDVLLLLGKEKSEGESRIALEQRLMQKRQ